MAKVIHINGKQVFTIDGVPFRHHKRILDHWHEELAKQIDDNVDYLYLETKVGWIEFHFNE